MAENIHKTFYFANTAKNKTNTNLKTGCAHQNSGKSIGLKLALFHVFILFLSLSFLMKALLGWRDHNGECGNYYYNFFFASVIMKAYVCDYTL